ncbi:MAG: nuclear transport factor 2 family protein [Janthinobacterium lividum]
MNSFLATAVLATLLSPSAAFAQVTNDNWEATVREFDRDYWKAFNACEVQKQTRMNAEDLEFYHDIGGVMRGRASFAEATAKNICGRSDWRLRRAEVPGTVKVYPLRSNGDVYGAVISGEHYFYQTNKGQPETLEGKAGFTHTLLLKNGVWQVARVLSFDHGPAK